MKIIALRTLLLPLAAGAALLMGCAAQNSRTQTSPPPTAPLIRANSQHNAALQNNNKTAKNMILDRYIARDEPIFAWKEIARKGNIVELEVISQKWQGIVWKHRVEIVRPARNDFPNRAMLNLGYGNGTERETFFAQLIANGAGATLVNGWNIPNQPLFDKREDDLIAHTFAKYLQDGDETWPLLLPMTKSATQIMRAVGQWSKQESRKTTAPNADKINIKPLKNWVVSGASKRGWTTWLAAAAVNTPSFQNKFKSDDVQVVGIIPMVYDNLNLARQMPHQIASWGRYSPQIDDYSRHGLPDLATTEKGQKLVQIVDPWVYRDRLKLPKLVINGSNDSYWPLDSFNLYRSDLSGPLNVFYAPNSGHLLNGNEAKVAGISVAWFRALAKNQTMPNVKQSVAATLKNIPHQKWTLQVLADAKTPNVKAARVWFASSKTRDFRQAQWQSLPLGNSTLRENTRTFNIDSQQLLEKSGVQKGEFLAAWGEIELVSDLPVSNALLNLNLPFLLSSPVTIWKQ